MLQSATAIMVTYSVKFKNAGTLVIAAGFFSDTLHQSGFQESFSAAVLLQEVPDGFFSAGNTVLLIPDTNRMQQKDFEYIRRFSLKVLSALKKGNVILLGNPEQTELLLMLAGYILLSLPKNKLKPEDLTAIRTLPFREVPAAFKDYHAFLSAAKAGLQNSSREKQASVPGPEKTFRPSWFTIRLKLASVIPGIITLALIAMISSASWLFRSHSVRLVQEYNLSLARLIGKKTEDAVSEIRKKSLFISEVISETGADSDLQKIFFRENPEIILVAEVKSGKESLTTVSYIINEAYLAKSGFKEDDILNSLAELSDNLSAVIQGDTRLMNVSPVFGRSLLALSFPYRTDSGLLVLADSSEFTAAFQTVRNADFFQIMLVSDNGKVIAHSDERVTLEAPDYSSVPVVGAMKSSKVDNSSLKYIYKNTEYLGSFQILRTGRIGVISTVESGRVFEAVYRIERQNFLITLIVLVIAFAVVFIFSRRITVPIAELVRATREIEAGNYLAPVVPATRDEIGILTNSFAAMARGLYEREIIKDIFGKFVNRSIAEKALRGEIKLGGEKKEAAVFFSDLRNFTGISESMQPENVVEMLNFYFTAMVECVHATGGVVDKYIGDALMAHWGAVTQGENDTKSAVDAALMMREELISMNEITGGKKFPILHFGAGINTGPVIAGQIGSEKKLEFTVIGDTVNLASRIEYLNKHFGTDILISSYSYEKVKDFYEVIEMPPLSIKGKSGKETVYAVLGRKGDPSCPRTLEELRQRLGIEFSMEQAEQSLRASSDKVLG